MIQLTMRIAQFMPPVVPTKENIKQKCVKIFQKLENARTGSSAALPMGLTNSPSTFLINPECTTVQENAVRFGRKESVLTVRVANFLTIKNQKEKKERYYLCWVKFWTAEEKGKHSYPKFSGVFLPATTVNFCGDLFI